jgi:hypothetical protein
MSPGFNMRSPAQKSLNMRAKPLSVSAWLEGTQLRAGAAMVQFQPARQDSVARWRDLWRQECQLLCFIESLLCFCYFSRSDIHSAFASLIQHGEWMPFLAQCGHCTLKCRASTARIGTSLWRRVFVLACFIYSRPFWHGNWLVFQQRLWR